MTWELQPAEAPLSKEGNAQNSQRGCGLAPTLLECFSDTTGIFPTLPILQGVESHVPESLDLMSAGWPSLGGCQEAGLGRGQVLSRLSGLSVPAAVIAE